MGDEKLTTKRELKKVFCIECDKVLNLILSQAYEHNKNKNNDAFIIIISCNLMSTHSHGK